LQGEDEPVPKSQHLFEFCHSCALIKCLLISHGLWDYAKEARVTGSQLPDYLREVIAELEVIECGPDDLIVDVGGNDGEFIDVLKKSGCRFLLNIEPSKRAAEISLGRGHMVENAYLDWEQASRVRAKYGPAKVVFCRHVLEHVSDPLSFLQALKLLILDEGVLFIETPDARGIIHDFLGHELWDQHLYYFTEINLKGLLSRSGLLVERLQTRPHRGGRNLLVWARPEDNLSAFEVPREEAVRDVYACHEFGMGWSRIVKCIQSDAETWPKPVVCFGASHPQSNYLNFTGIGKHVSLLVDDDSAKIGKWLPVPQPVRIVSTRDLLSGPLPGTIVRTAFGCENWMDPICRSMADKGVRVVEPYPERPH